MIEQRDRLARALRGCAEAGVPDTVDLWSEIEERVSPAPWRSRSFRFVPRTRMGWVVVTLATLMVVGTGAYAASGLVESDLTIEKATLQPGIDGDEIVVQARVTGMAELPMCYLIDGMSGNESSWYDDDLTEAVEVGDTTIYTFHENRDTSEKATDTNRPPLVATCSAGIGPGGNGPGVVRSDEARVKGTPEGIEKTSQEREFIRKDMSSPLIKPPVSTLSAEGRSVEGKFGQYCWSPPRSEEEENVLWCWDPARDVTPNEASTLRVPAGSSMTFDFEGTAKPDSVLAGAFPLFQGKVTGRPVEDLRVTQQGDLIKIPADIPAGEYGITVGVFGSEGEASYSFRVVVERNASR